MGICGAAGTVSAVALLLGTAGEVTGASAATAAVAARELSAGGAMVRCSVVCACLARVAGCSSEALASQASAGSSAGQRGPTQVRERAGCAAPGSATTARIADHLAGRSGIGSCAGRHRRRQHQPAECRCVFPGQARLSAAGHSKLRAAPFTGTTTLGLSESSLEAQARHAELLRKVCRRAGEASAASLRYAGVSALLPCAGRGRAPCAHSHRAN